MKKITRLNLKCDGYQLGCNYDAIMIYFDGKSLNTEGTKKEIIAEIKKWMNTYKMTKEDTEIYNEAIS